MNEVWITYVGGQVYDYRTDSEISLGFDARLGWVSVYVDGDEISHPWDLLGSVRAEGEVKLIDVYSS